MEELSTSSWPSDDLLPPAQWWQVSKRKQKPYWLQACVLLLITILYICVRLRMSDQAPLSLRWAAWSSCRCRTGPPPREQHASRPRGGYPGFYHASSGFYGNQWSSGSTMSNNIRTVRSYTSLTKGQTIINYKILHSLFIWAAGVAKNACLCACWNLVVLQQDEAEVELAEG